MEITPIGNQALSKLSDQFSAAEIWRKLRSDLAPEISEAHKILREYTGVNAFLTKLGFNVMDRKRRISQIMGNFRPQNIDEFMHAYHELLETFHPPEASELARQLAAGISQRFMRAAGIVLDLAIKAIVQKQQDAQKAENDLFLAVGLPAQKTAITAVVDSIAEKLRNTHKNLFVASHGIPVPSSAHVGELFVDEDKKFQDEIEALKAAGTLDYLNAIPNSVRFGDKGKSPLAAEIICEKLPE